MSLPRQSSRSERLLQDVLAKDGVALKRSLSRGSTSTAPRRPLADVAPPLPPTDSPMIQRSIVRSSSSSGGSSSDERPVFGSINGLGAHSAVLYRPHMPSPRKTHDGAFNHHNNRSASPSPPHRHPTAPPAPLVHANSSPASPRDHSPTGEWASDEASSPGTMSFFSSGYSSASHLPGTPFNLDSANQYCRQQQGYVSFGEIEGLGWPAGEEEDERLERQRLEIENKRKKGWWSWIEDVTTSRPKTPANTHDLE